MKEFKFRAWDSVFKEMLYENNRGNRGRVKEIMLNEDIGVYNKDSRYKYNPFIFMQYTGLLDENKKEIYELDILEFDFLGFGETESVSYIGFIKWNNERYRYDIEVVSHGDRHGDNYIFDLGKCIDRIKNFKIVDTIQENKLGLIEE